MRLVRTRLPRPAIVLSAALCSLALSVLAPAAGAGTYTPVAVAELFTSQGCSSCPPADRLWNELARRDDVLALTLPVDYWDYLGWKDTLASPANTARQRGYARALQARSIYTPQAIINGAIDVVASRRAEVLAALAAARTGPDGIGLDISAGPQALTITANAEPGSLPEPATVWLVVFTGEETVAIGRGENAGRTIRYSNVVRAMYALGELHVGTQRFAYPRGSLPEAADMKCAVMVQPSKHQAPGPVRAAAVLDGSC
ncbi:MAG: DUF1223 domain-containing protein [Rhodobacteraceae bacterium]|nr:DUF1223 domain-containing protein [Paracoccaceae bacterium]